MNTNIYQVPPAEQQLESTGKYLQLLDEGAHLYGSSKHMIHPTFMVGEHLTIYFLKK